MYKYLGNYKGLDIFYLEKENLINVKKGEEVIFIEELNKIQNEDLLNFIYAMI